MSPPVAGDCFLRVVADGVTTKTSESMDVVSDFRKRGIYVLSARQIFLYRFLKVMLEGKHVQVRRRKASAGKKQPNDSSSGGCSPPSKSSQVATNQNTTSIFLRDFCTSLKLSQEGKKVEMIERLYRHCVINPHLLPKRFEEELSNAEWLEAKQTDEQLKSDFENIIATGAEHLETTDYPLPFLRCVYYSKKLGIFPPPPDKPVLLFLSFGFSVDKIHAALSKTNVSNFKDDFPSQPEATHSLKNQRTNQRTNCCALRLFLILLADGDFYSRLLHESQAPSLRVTRVESGPDKLLADIKFWRDVRSAFVDDTYPMPHIPVDHAIFKNERGKFLNVSLCKSKHVTYTQLRKFYHKSHNLLCKIRHEDAQSDKHKIHDKASLNEIVEKYSTAQKEVSFLAALVKFRGYAAMKWFSGEILPDWGSDGLETQASWGTAASCSSESSISSADTKDSQKSNLSEMHIETLEKIGLPASLKGSVASTDTKSQRSYHSANVVKKSEKKRKATSPESSIASSPKGSVASTDTKESSLSARNILKTVKNMEVDAAKSLASQIVYMEEKTRSCVRKRQREDLEFYFRMFQQFRAESLAEGLSESQRRMLQKEADRFLDKFLKKNEEHEQEED